MSIPLFRSMNITHRYISCTGAGKLIEKIANQLIKARVEFSFGTSNRPRIALLLFGLLNTFEQVNGRDSDYTGIYKALKTLDVDVDVYVDTSPISFIKIPSEFDLSMRSRSFKAITKARRLIARVPASSAKTKDYLVLKDPASAVANRLMEILGEDLVSLNFTKSDPDTWSGPKYFQTMIKTYLKRKKRLVKKCIKYSKKNDVAYGAVIIARPDSAFKVRDTKSRSLGDIRAALLSDLSRVIKIDEVGVDSWPSNHSTSDKDVLMLKGAAIISSFKYASYIGSLIDEVDSKGYLNTYNGKAFLCEDCKSLFRQETKHCRSCGGTRIRDVSNWPEYKYAEHIMAGPNDFFYLGITGDTIRI